MKDKDLDIEDLKKFKNEAIRRFKGNASNPLTLNLIWLILVIIAFFCGMLVGAIHYSKLANETIQEVLNEISEDRYLNYQNSPEKVKEIFEKYQINLNKTLVSD